MKIRLVVHVIQGDEKYIQSLVGKPEGNEIQLQNWIRSEDSIKLGTCGEFL